MPSEARRIDAQHWSLRLLGECGLRAADGAPITLSTRKALAILAYLARQPERRATRERLASLLWEDAAPAQARLNLRKALSSLRQETRLPGAPAAMLIEANNDAVWLAPGALASDVEALDVALSAIPDAPA
ncbi:MAG: AfsR/SARP family transcriptional regulator, partial [Phenylobacterium sp.]